MRLLVQIPCLNESATLGSVLKDIPKSIKGISEISTLLINDGSQDDTIQVGVDHNITYIIENKSTLGLGTTFRKGAEFAIKNNFDILVNTDGDNQYPSSYITDLVQPILCNSADICIGDRNTAKVKHFSITKKLLQAFGTKVVQLLINDRNIKDAVSGFRAYNRTALKQIHVTSKFSYVLDSTIQAKIKGLRLSSVNITTNPPSRPSRLFTNDFQHVRKSAADILRIYAMYRPLRVFLILGLILLLVGLIPMVRFLYDYFWGSGGVGKIQSLIIGSTFILSSAIMFALGIIADLLAKNRMLIERLLEKESNQ